MAPRTLKHKDDRHVQTRLDYMLLYRSESKAKIIRIVETWMDTKYAECFKGTADSKEQKSEPPAEDLWVTMSYDQFSLFVYGTIQHDTIKQQVDELVATKHLERRVHPVYPYGPPQYRLNLELVQKSLDELEIPGNLFDLQPLFVTPRKKRTPQEKYPQGRGKNTRRDPGKIPPARGETSYPSNKHTKNTNNHTKNEGTYPAPESTPPSDADASTRTPASQDDYVPDFTANQSASQEKQANEQHSTKPPAQDVPRTAEISASAGQAEYCSPAVVNPPRGRGRGKKAAEPVVEFTEQGRKVNDAWGSLFKSPPRAGEKTIECANDLAPRLIPWCKDLKMSCRDLLKEIKDFLFATDTNGFYKRGVTLCDVGRDFEKWQSAKEHELEETKKKSTASASMPFGVKRWTPPANMPTLYAPER